MHKKFVHASFKKNVQFNVCFYFVLLHLLQFALQKRQLCLKEKTTLNTELLQYCMFPSTLVHHSKCLTRHIITHFNSSPTVGLFIIHTSHWEQENALNQTIKKKVQHTTVMQRQMPRIKWDIRDFKKVYFFMNKIPEQSLKVWGTLKYDNGEGRIKWLWNQT